MEERKLAHIELIESIHPIEGADKIEMCKVLGWECVVKKGEFQVGEKIIYIEVDSVVPDKPEYEFLRDRKFRVRTIKLRGQISQGLVLPLHTLLDVFGNNSYNVGDNVTEKLGIAKYLTPSEVEANYQQELAIKNNKSKLQKFMLRYKWYRKLFLSRTAKSGFPYWVSKTDEERIQNIPHVLKQFADKEVYVTEKIDYQSVTFTGQMVNKFDGILGKLFSMKKYKFIVCSRNLTTNDRSSLYWRVAAKYNIEAILTKYPNLTIQGEQGNIGIQKNKYELSEPKMWVFNIINHNTKKHFDYDEMATFCVANKLDYVPLLKKCKLSELGSTVEEVVNYSKGNSVINPKIQREGIVIRCIECGNKVLSFKVINPEFLLKYQDE